jgi:predicted DCC family thiol-disulfide oxidoreductase YuxK
LLRFDRRDIFRFSARQNSAGASFLHQVGLPECGAGSIILVERGAVLLRSAAVLRMMSLLGFPFSLAAVFRFVPATLRDLVYEWFARNPQMVRTSHVPRPIRGRASSIPLISCLASRRAGCFEPPFVVAYFSAGLSSLQKPDKPDKSHLSH